MRLLMVEDNEDLGEAIASRLSAGGHSVEWVMNGEQALRYLEMDNWDVLLLDIMLPDQDGFSILRHLRRQTPSLPVLVMTARSEIEDRVSMLDLGADDYLVKPFDLRELEARLRALMRRPATTQAEIWQLGHVSIDIAARRINSRDQTVEFGQREFCLLELLLSRAGQVVTKERLVSEVFNFNDAVAPNALEVYVARLRRKLLPDGPTIRTIRGLGYMIEAK